MPQRRDHKAEYQRRVARAEAQGFSRSQARGHPKAGEQSTKAARLSTQRKLDSAILSMNRGASLTIAAREVKLSRQQLLDALRGRGLVKRERGRWIIRDRRHRPVSIFTQGRRRTITVVGFSDASLTGSYQHAVREFLRTGDRLFLEPFVGVTVRAHNGKRYVLETDPNELYRLDTIGGPEFHEIYAITQRS